MSKKQVKLPNNKEIQKVEVKLAEIDDQIAGHKRQLLEFDRRVDQS